MYKLYRKAIQPYYEDSSYSANFSKPLVKEITDLWYDEDLRIPLSNKYPSHYKHDPYFVLKFREKFIEVCCYDLEGDDIRIQCEI